MMARVLTVVGLVLKIDRIVKVDVGAGRLFPRQYLFLRGYPFLRFQRALTAFELVL